MLCYGEVAGAMREDGTGGVEAPRQRAGQSRRRERQVGQSRRLGVDDNVYGSARWSAGIGEKGSGRRRQVFWAASTCALAGAVAALIDTESGACPIGPSSNKSHQRDAPDYALHHCTAAPLHRCTTRLSTG